MLHSTTRIFGPLFTTTPRSLSTARICCLSDRNFASSTSGQRKQFTKSNVNPKVPTILLENRCAFVRTWDFLRNPAEALALIHAVEQKYGPVESFLFQKDFDTPSTYQAQVKVTFKNIESFHRVPEDFETLHIRAPKVQPKRPGGIGLDEIQRASSGDVEFLTADQVSEIASEERTIDFRVERANRAYFEESPYRFTGLNHKYRKEIGTKMLEWGGFHKMKPIESTRPITNEELTEESLDHVHMRRALREWAEYLGVRNPYEIYPEEKGQLNGESARTETKETQRSSLTTTTEQNPGTRRQAPSPPLDGWAIVDPPTRVGTVREPLEQLLEMEDIQVTAKLPEIPEDGPQPRDLSSEDAPSSSEARSEEPTSETQPTPFTIDLTTIPTASVPSVEQPTTNSLHGSEALETKTPLQPTSLSPLSTSRSKTLLEEFNPQLRKAEQSEDPVKSPYTERKEKTQEKERLHDQTGLEGGSGSNGDLEDNPRFGNFFNRLQDILKKS